MSSIIFKTKIFLTCLAALAQWNPVQAAGRVAGLSDDILTIDLGSPVHAQKRRLLSECANNGRYPDCVCDYLVSRGFCSSQDAHMRRHCPKSCAFCGSAVPVGPITIVETPAGVCENRQDVEGCVCQWMVSAGWCSPPNKMKRKDRKLRFMRKNCPLACGFCSAATTETPDSTTAEPAGLRIAALLRSTNLVNEGEEVTLLCLSAGSPSPTFTWTRENSAALPAVPDGNTGTLVIGSVRPEDDGVYTCRADNGVEVATSDVSFNVCPDVGDCSDSNAGCVGWALNGYCESNPSYMRSNCRLSCGVCHPDLPAKCLTIRRGRSWDTWECQDVTNVPDEVRSELGLDPFYQKYLHAYGIPILGSSGLPDDALRRACYDVLFMLADRRDLRDRYFDVNGRAAIMTESEVTLDIPEHSTLDPSFNERARGLGGVLNRPVSTGAEENVLCYNHDRYKPEDIFVHEFAHGVHEMAANGVISDFNSRLISAYDDAMANGRFDNTYAAADQKEYWAEGVQSYFNVNQQKAVPDGIHNFVNTREELLTYDPALYDLIHEIFPCENIIVNRCVKDYDASEIRVDCKNGLARNTISGTDIFQ